jgi:hypothetical protein
MASYKCWARRVYARSIKTTLVLDGATFIDLTAPSGQPRVQIDVVVAGRKVAASIVAKSALQTCWPKF